MDGRLVGLEVDRDDRGDRAGREPGLGQRVMRQRGNFLGRDAALAADTERQDRRVEDERIIAGRGGTVADEDLVGLYFETRRQSRRAANRRRRPLRQA